MMNNTNKDSIGRRYFAAKVVRALAKRGIAVIGAFNAPGANGSYANGETAFELDDNGTHRVRGYLQVLAIAQGCSTSDVSLIKSAS